MIRYDYCGFLVFFEHQIDPIVPVVDVHEEQEYCRQNTIAVTHNYVVYCLRHLK